MAGLGVLAPTTIYPWVGGMNPTARASAMRGM